MEFPYVVADGPYRDMVLARIQKVFSRDDDARSAKDILSRIFGRKPRYIGIFSTLFKRFAHRFYEHAPGHNKRRFHYSDARFEFNVKRFLSPTSQAWMLEFHRRVPSVATFRRVVEAFLLGYRRKESFQEQMRGIFGSWITPFDPSLTSKRKNGPKTLHKIAKQVYKLPPTWRSLMEAFIKEKLDGLCDMLRRDLRYEDGVRLIGSAWTYPTTDVGMVPTVPLTTRAASKKPRSSFFFGGAAAVAAAETQQQQQQRRFSRRSGVREDMRQDGTLSYIRASRLRHYLGIFAIFMELIAQTVMMDVYLLARMLYYVSLPASAGGTTIVYAGDYHISVYADFMMRYVKLRPLGCFAPRFPDGVSDAELQDAVQRCVQVNLGTCNGRT